MNRYFYLIFFSLIVVDVLSKENCSMNKILINDQFSICKSKEITTGYLKFKSNESNLEYKTNSKYNLKYLRAYENQILEFIEINCQNISNSKIKEIINHDSLTSSYNFIIIVSC